jgi:hypothetical protein
MATKVVVLRQGSIRGKAEGRVMERTDTTMRKTTIAIATLTLFLTFGCSKGSTASTSKSSSPSGNAEATAAQANLTPEELGELGAQIKKNPSDAQKLLSEKGLTERSFEHAIRKVAENPEESKRYAEAYKKASA